MNIKTDRALRRAEKVAGFVWFFGGFVLELATGIAKNARDALRIVRGAR